MGQCWDQIPEDPVFDVANLSTKKKFELYNQGIVLIKDIPDEVKLSDKQRIQVEGVKNNTSYVDSFFSYLTVPYTICQKRAYIIH